MKTRETLSEEEKSVEASEKWFKLGMRVLHKRLEDMYHREAEIEKLREVVGDDNL